MICSKLGEIKLKILLDLHFFFSETCKYYSVSKSCLILTFYFVLEVPSCPWSSSKFPFKDDCMNDQFGGYK
jgi:hypothetical protein